MAAERAAKQHDVFLRLTNSRSAAVTFVLEPWGEQYEMAAGATFDVFAHGPRDDSLEVSMGGDSITVWGWSGSIVRVYHDGAELGHASRRPPSPLTPQRATALPGER